MNYFNEERLSSADLMNNCSTRLPVCLCVDASYSMLKEDRMQHVNHGIRSFIKNSYEDIYARDAVDLCLITFSGRGVKTNLDFKNIGEIYTNKLFQDIEPYGKTPMAKAIMVALDKIETRKHDYESMGTTFMTPWLIIMSDGEATDQNELPEATRRLLSLQTPQPGRKRLLKVKCIGIESDEGTQDLARLTPSHKVDSCGALEIENFFAMLSRSTAGLSQASPGEEDAIEKELGLTL